MMWRASAVILVHSCCTTSTEITADRLKITELLEALPKCVALDEVLLTMLHARPHLQKFRLVKPNVFFWVVGTRCPLFFIVLLSPLAFVLWLGPVIRIRLFIVSTQRITLASCTCTLNKISRLICG
jgi:hypothetical protein